jgi:cyclophilin family peptidyl-prolyl cis-trans isomerase
MAPLTLLVALSSLAGCGDAKAPDKPTTAAVENNACADIHAPKPKDDGGGSKPKAPLDATKTNTITFKTSCGDFTVTLDVKNAPRGSASVASLARTGFYDNTVFHRIVPGFVIQGGDPTGSGSGGPGYQVVEAPPRTAKYTRGVVAMAKKPDEPAGTSGSQFFVVTAADAGLPPDYAIIGAVSTGMSTVKRIESLGSPSEQPSKPVVIRKAIFNAR